MERRRFLSQLAAGSPWVLSAGVSANAATDSRKKKGWAGGAADLHRAFRANWYYTWSPKTRPDKATEFVPMIKGSWSLKQAPAIRSMKGISHLLGFNEPERSKQGNISVEDALKLWPRLAELAEARNLRLGSPAPSSDRDGLAWLDRFMAQGQRQGLKVDFVAFHWYRGTDPEGFEKLVRELHKKWDLPIWVTEFNGWSGTEEANYRFLDKSLEFLKKRDEVERYAYFNPKKGSPHSLLKADGSLSRMGELYRDA